MHLGNSLVENSFIYDRGTDLAVAADISHPYLSSCAGLTGIYLFLTGGVNIPHTVNGD